MTRFVSTTNGTAADAEHVSLRLAVALDFPSGIVRAHDGLGTLTFGGFDYLGVGTFGGIEDVAEELETISRGVKMTLAIRDTANVTPDLLTSAMTEAYQSRAATVYLCLINPDTGALVDTPETLWDGDMDVMTFRAEDGSAVLELTCEDELNREPRISRYTDQDQQRTYAGDKFFERLSKIDGYVTQWGAATVGSMGGMRPAEGPRRGVVNDL